MLFDPKNPKKFCLVPTPSKQEDTDGTGTLKAWSNSIFGAMNKCPYRVYLQNIKRLKPKKNEFSQRGIDLHAAAEQYVKGELIDLPEELESFSDKFDYLKSKYQEGNIFVEQQWAFDKEWNVVKWFSSDTWYRMVVDVYIQESPTSVRLIDYKTGKKFGNEMSHNIQLCDYAVGIVSRFPETEFIKSELWYLDTGEVTIKEWPATLIKDIFKTTTTKRGLKITNTTEFLPRPSKNNCKYCGFFDNGCKWGIKNG